jgi:hypothetical protein
MKHADDHSESIADFKVVHASLELVRELEEGIHENSDWGSFCLILVDLLKSTRRNPNEAILDLLRSDSKEEVAKHGLDFLVMFI